MLDNDGNVDKKFQLSIFYRSRENHIFPKTFQTDRHTDRGVASLLNICFNKVKVLNPGQILEKKLNDYLKIISLDLGNTIIQF